MLNKISKFIARPISLLILWIVFFASQLVNAVRIKYALNHIFYRLHIPGAFQLVFYFPNAVSIILSLILIYWFIEYVKGKLKVIKKRYLVLLSTSTLVLILISSYLLKLESDHYANYIYSRFGITTFQLTLIIFVAILQLMIFASMYYFSYTKRGLKSFNSFETSIIRFAFFTNLYGIFVLIIFSVLNIFSFPFLHKTSMLNYEGRVGTHYKYIEKLSSYTPTNCFIIHPPQIGPWAAIGNQPILRYFLFPRTLISGTLLVNQDFANSIKNAYFVEIDPGVELSHWPIIDLANKQVVFNKINPIKYKTLKIDSDYNGIKIYYIEF